MLLWIVALLLLLLYIVLDVHYFLRMAFTFIFAKYFRKKITPLDPSSLYVLILQIEACYVRNPVYSTLTIVFLGIVLPSDADFLMTHMNNSRYLREFDFARIDHATRTGVLSEILKRGGNFPVSAITMRYRLPAMMFSVYQVITRPVYWDAKFIYLDQRLVTMHDGIVRSVGYAKIACVKFNGEELFSKLFPDIKRPEMPEDLKKWNEACEISSEMMKKKN